MRTSGTTTERGYGSDHQRERDKYKPLIDSGQGWCCEVVCLMRTRWIRPGSDWDLAHTEDRSSYRGPAHRLCNRSEGSKRGNRRRRRPGRRQVPPPAWRTSRRW